MRAQFRSLHCPCSETPLRPAQPCCPKRKWLLKALRTPVPFLRFSRIHIIVPLEGPVYIAVMFGLIAGLFAAGIDLTLGSKSLKH